MPDKSKDILRCTLLFLLLLLPVFYALVAAADLEYSWTKKAAYLAVVMVLLLLPALFLKARTYFIVQGIFNFLFFPVEMASLYLNRQPASAPFLEIIAHTDAAEAGELLLSLWPVCIAVIALWVLYFTVAARVKDRELFGPIAGKILIGCAGGAIIAGLLAMTLFLKQIHEERTFGEAIVEATGLVKMKLYKIYPYNLYIHATSLLQKKHRVRRLQENVSVFRFGIHRAEPSSELYILVIGEASRYDHWGINGYGRNTTPRLSACANLISYDSVYTQANLTEYAVSLLLTRATAERMETAYAEKSLPEAFQEAGAWSGYISKQLSFDLTERIRSNCDYSRFYSKNFDLDGNYDIQMIEDLRSTLADTMQFYLLHSLGSHFRYEHRYPDAFECFKPVLGKAAGYSVLTESNKELLVNAYDNSILYTDWFLSSLIETVDSLDRVAAILYVSDHGESFWDDEHRLSLHGSYQVSEAEYHVPFVIWYSDEYAALYPERTAAMHKNKTTPVSSDVVFYSMLGMAGIEGLSDSTRCVCSPALAPIDSVRVCTGSGAVETMVLR
jgi:glucan phosphoethanolaminetransferase (alkaline phosphatase superfamily)